MNGNAGFKSDSPYAKGPKTIVVPIDFSEFSQKALRYAAAFSAESDSQMILVSVIERPLPGYDSAYVPSTAAELSALAWYREAKTCTQEKLANFAAKTLAGLRNYTCVTRTGEPAKEILSVARNRHADLIVMGTHGRTGVKHMLLGSVAEKTLRHAPCPVLVLRLDQGEFVKDATEGPRLNLHEIIAPLDFSTGSTEAFAWAEALAERTGARLNIMHVVPYHYALGEYDALEYPELEAELIESGRQRLATLDKTERQKGVKVHSVVLRGVPRHEISEFARQQKGDLVVMGTRGLTGINRLLLGSTAEYLVRHAPCAVLTVPYPKAIRNRMKIAETNTVTG